MASWPLSPQSAPEHSNDENAENDEKRNEIHLVVKPLIEEIMHRCNIYRSKRVHNKIHDNEYEKIKKISLMPSLQQIDNYIKYRRKLIRDNSSTDELLEYSKSRHHSLVEDNNQLFVLGTIAEMGMMLVCSFSNCIL